VTTVERFDLIRTRADRQSIEAIGERPGLRQVRPAIAQPIGAERNEATAGAERQFPLQPDRSAMIVGEKILRAGREPFDRPAELLGHMQHERILG
jgi:hypothetical protein